MSVGKEVSKEPLEELRPPRRKDREARWWAGPVRRVTGVCVRLLLAAVLSTGEVLGRCAPFGLALVGACGPGVGGFAALVGAVGGYLLSRELEEALRYAAGCILVFAVSFAFYDLPIYRRAWFMPLSAGALDLLTGLVTLQSQVRLHPGRVLPLLAAECALTVLGVYAFRSAFALWRGRREDTAVPALDAQGADAAFRQRVCLVLLAMAVLISLAELKLGMVSVGRLLAGWLALWAGWSQGVGAGAALGLCAGLAMDLSLPQGRIYALTYAFSGLAAGVFRKHGRTVSALCYAVAGAISALWSWTQIDPVATVAELLLAGGLFLLTPQRLLDRCTVLFAGETGDFPAAYAAQAAQHKLQTAAAAFQQAFSALKDALNGKTTDNGEDPAVIYDRAANQVCASCALRERCWQRDYQDTHDLLNAALPNLLTSRSATPDQLPQRFRDKCVKLPAFLGAVEQEVRAYLLRGQCASQIGRSRRAVCTQLEQVAEVLEDAAAAMASPYLVDAVKTRRVSRFLAARGLNCQGLALIDAKGHLQLQFQGPDGAALAAPAAVLALSSALDTPLALVQRATAQRPTTLLRQREPLSALAGVATRRKEGETVSGDACAWFKDDLGTLYLLLCDGMGAGPAARAESELTIDLLEKFLKAGFSPENALKTLDEALALRLEETGGFSTVDLLTLDLFSGRGTLYKLGAAPTYLRQEGKISRLQGKGLPAGLADQAGPPDVFPLQLGPGDCLALVTDGVLEETEEGGDRWLSEALEHFEGGSPAALAEAIVGHGESGRDDKTALVVRLSARPDDHLTKTAV